MYGLALAMKLPKEHMYGLQGKRSVTPTGILANQTTILPRIMAVFIIILDCGGMIMAQILITMLWKRRPRLRHFRRVTYSASIIMGYLMAMNN